MGSQQRTSSWCRESASLRVVPHLCRRSTDPPPLASWGLWLCLVGCRPSQSPWAPGLCQQRAQSWLRQSGTGWFSIVSFLLAQELHVVDLEDFIQAKLAEALHGVAEGGQGPPASQAVQLIIHTSHQSCSGSPCTR